MCIRDSINADIFDEADHGSSGKLLNVFILFELSQPALLFSQASQDVYKRQEGIVGSPRAAAGQGVEYGALANIRQADDT